MCRLSCGRDTAYVGAETAAAGVLGFCRLAANKYIAAALYQTVPLPGGDCSSCSTDRVDLLRAKVVTLEWQPACVVFHGTRLHAVPDLRRYADVSRG